VAAEEVGKREVDRRGPRRVCYGRGECEGVLASRQSQSQQADNGAARGAPRVHRQLYGGTLLLGSSST
jgi:hypothetical protein